MISTLTILSLDQGNIYVPPRDFHGDQTAESSSAQVLEPGRRRWNLPAKLLGFTGLFLGHGWRSRPRGAPSTSADPLR